MNGSRFLSRILESNGIFLPVQDICGIGRKLFYIVASDRQVCFDLTASVPVKRDNLNQSVCRDRSTACGNKFLGGKKSEADVFYFIAVADIEDVVLFDCLFIFTADSRIDQACGAVVIEKTFDDVIKQGEIEGLTFNADNGRFLLLYNRGARIIAGMPSGFYEGYTEEIHEVFVYDMKKND